MAIIGKKRAKKQTAPAKPANPRQTAPAQQQAPQNGIVITADGRVFLFHRTMGYKLLQKKHIDAAVMAAFGSK